MALIVLDIGTSSMRGILYSRKGIKKYTAQADYSPMYLEHDWVEQNPLDWKSGMETVLKACVEFGKMAGEVIEAVSVTSQRSSVIPIGADEKPAANAVMWQDKRVLKMVSELSGENDRIFHLAGSKVNPVFSGIKMKWIRECNPELYRKTKRLVVIPDFVIHEMTGQWITDTTYGSRSLLMNLRSRQWDDELLELFHVDKEKLCPITEPGSVVGTITKECHDRTGLQQGVPVISAGGDQQCAALGMGIIRQGSAELSAGTGAYLLAAVHQVPDEMKNNIICNASAIPGHYVMESSILSCAGVFNWLLRLCYGLSEENKQEVYRTVNREMSNVLDKKSPLLALPFFQGRGTPDWNSKARGCIHNLTLGTSRAELAKAILEGLAYEISVNLDIIQNYTGEVTAVSACGGIANSPVFCNILPNVLNRTVRTYSDNEATALGAWISASVTLGIHKNYSEAFTQARKEHEFLTGSPVPERVGVYREGKEGYLRLYEQLYHDSKCRSGGK